MSVDEKAAVAASVRPLGDHHEDLTAVKHADDVLLAQLGYKSEFKREFAVSLVFPAFMRALRGAARSWNVC